jgi:hypothetical protein
MGGLIQVKDDRWDAWTGGKPTADWTRLEDSNVDPGDIMLSPFRTHSLYSSSATNSKLNAASALTPSLRPLAT